VRASESQLKSETANWHGCVSTARSTRAVGEPAMLCLKSLVATTPGCTGPRETSNGSTQLRYRSLSKLSIKVSVECTSVLSRLCQWLAFVLLSFDAHTSGWRAPSHVYGTGRTFSFILHFTQLSQYLPLDFFTPSIRSS
jgi:hypothetical protein